MGIPWREKLKQLPLEEQEKIKERSAELMAEEMTRQQLRQLFKITQEQMGQILQLDQGNVSRIEQRSDLMISTLQKYAQAVGGKLRLFVEFPDRPPINLVSILEEEKPVKPLFTRLSNSFNH